MRTLEWDLSMMRRGRHRASYRVQPGMAHGIAFGLAAATLAAWLRVEESSSLSSWVVVGAATRLLTLVRFQVRGETPV